MMAYFYVCVTGLKWTHGVEFFGVMLCIWYLWVFQFSSLSCVLFQGRHVFFSGSVFPTIWKPMSFETRFHTPVFRKCGTNRSLQAGTK